MSDDKPNLQPIAVVFVGRTENDKGEPAVQWLPVALIDTCETADQATDLASAFTVKRSFRYPPSVGAVYIVEGVLDDNGRLVKAVTSGWKFNPAHHNNSRNINREWIAVWEARADAVLVAARARKVLADLSKDKMLPAVLGKLRQRFTQTDRIGRLALEVVVLNCLRN